MNKILTAILTTLLINLNYGMAQATNGEKPFFGSTMYSEPITISNTQVVKAIVFADDPSILPSFITFKTLE